MNTKNIIDFKVIADELKATRENMNSYGDSLNTFKSKIQNKKTNIAP